VLKLFGLDKVKTDSTPEVVQIRLTWANSITVSPVHWLLKDRLALGSFALLAGREGLGKTTVAYTWVADITRGVLDGVCHGQPRSVFIAATEDSWSHTIVPRLMAAGADLGRVARVGPTGRAPDPRPSGTRNGSVPGGIRP
jgi:hypothetical protein